MSRPTEPWEVPPSWGWTTIGEVAEVTGGGTPSTKQPEYYDGGTVPWITPADLSGYSAKYIDSGNKDITERGLRESSARLLPAGTVLFSSRAPIGYVAIASRPVATNQGFKSFTLSDGLDPEYVYYYLKRATQLAVDLSSGTTFREISGAKAKQIPFPVAPLPEQRRIADALDSYMSRLDAAEAALKRVQASLERYRASVLQAAVEGRLVPTEAELAREESRAYEPAEVLLDRILLERRARWEEAGLAQLEAKGTPPKNDRWKQKYKGPVAPDLEGSPELPEGWCWATVDQLLTEPLRNGHSARASSDGHGIRTLTLSAVTKGDFSESNTKLTIADARKVADLWLVPGDILVERSNTAELVGTTREYNGPQGYAIFPDLMIRVRVSKHVQGRFIESVLRSDRSHTLFRERAKGLAGSMPKIDQATVASLAVPLAPRSEQSRIGNELDRRLSVADEVASELDDEIAQVGRLRQAVLAAAFEGRLVDQDPADEPASELLARMTAEHGPRAPDSRASRREPSTPRTAVLEASMLHRDDVSATHLSSILGRAGQLSPEELWAASKLGIDDFYEQLKDEEARGLVRERRSGVGDETRLLEASE